MSSRPFTLALAQMRVEPGAKEQNLTRAIEVIAEAARGGAQVILLPEALNFGWTDPSARELADAIPTGETCRLLSRAASEHRIHVCAGMIERADDKLYNSAVLFNPSGEMLLHHRKINELEIAHGIYSLGDRIQVADTELGRIGVMICADAFIRGQVISRTLAAMGAQLILSPCAWAVPSNHDNEKEPYGQLWLDHYGAVAREFGIWMAGASNVGPIDHGAWAGRKCIGCSLLVGPDGNKAAQGPYGESAETILYAEITPGAGRRPVGEPGL